MSSQVILYHNEKRLINVVLNNRFQNRKVKLFFLCGNNVLELTIER
jgi:hypothetical protein